ncbi:MAG: hypothetical protein LBR05_03025 [Azoarcus sp.]|jgi:hypothetical protein|nr:hypothetical protein [Azoarcus sp.]
MDITVQARRLEETAQWLQMLETRRRNGEITNDTASYQALTAIQGYIHNTNLVEMTIQAVNQAEIDTMEKH